MLEVRCRSGGSWWPAHCPFEGKSTIVFNLGLAFGEVGKRVIIADADFHRPTLHRIAKTAARKGFTDLLAGTSKLIDTITPDHRQRPARPARQRPHRPRPHRSRDRPAGRGPRRHVGRGRLRADGLVADPAHPDNLYMAAAADGIVLVVAVRADAASGPAAHQGDSRALGNADPRRRAQPDAGQAAELPTTSSTARTTAPSPNQDERRRTEPCGSTCFGRSSRRAPRASASSDSATSGLSLAVELAKAGFTVRGIDLDLERVSLLNRGESYLVDVPAETLAPLVADGRLYRHPPPSRTPAPGGRPDHLRPDAAPEEQGAGHLVHPVGGGEPAAAPAPGQLMVLESTTYPGTTEEVVQPRLESAGSASIGARLLPGLLAGAGGSREQAVHHRQHPQGGRRRDARLHRAGGGALPAGDLERVSRSRARGWPRRPSCWRTPSAA